MRFINAIFTAVPDEVLSNERLFPHYLAAVDALPLDEETRAELSSSIKYFLIGERTRYSSPGWLNYQVKHMRERAEAFERGTEILLDKLASQVLEAIADKPVVFDALLTTTTTGNLMPGLSYRMAARLGGHVRTDSCMLDLGNVGCTGGVKLLKLASQLGAEWKNVLLIAVEQPTTLVAWDATQIDVWQGNCTFGDGAAAVWLSQDPEQGDMALRLDMINDIQLAEQGLDMIYWGYSDYYSFRLGDEKSFDKKAQSFVLDALRNVEDNWRQTPQWAIHPAGITLLMRLSRKLGISKQALQPSLAHYQKYSNMSSASILFVLKDVSIDTSVGQGINLITMGAGFNVIYGQVHKER